MNQYPLWRYLLVAVVIAAGALYALPNLYGYDPALQISARRAQPVDDALRERVAAALDEAGIAFKRIDLEQKRLLIRFPDNESRSAARDVVVAAVGDQDYIVALNLASATPAWLRDLGGEQMYMGLDLRGGVHFLMQVDMNAVRVQTDERFVSELRAAFREDKVRYRSITRSKDGGIDVEFLNEEMKARGTSKVASSFPDLSASDGAEPTQAHYEVSEQVLQDIRRTAIKQNLTTLRNRVNEFGVAEPVIQQQGEDRIVVQLPGVEDTAEAKKILGATATLEFRMVDTDGDVQAAVDGRVPLNSKLYHDRAGNPLLLDKRIMLTGEYIIDASSGIEQQTGSPAVFITLDGKGARIFSRATREQIGKPMAVVYIEQRKGRPVEEVINVATIRDQLSKRFQITGLDTTDEARTLALLLRAGALAAPIEIVEERTVGPSLGQDNIDKGFKSMVIGMAAVLVFMALYYKVFGLIADLALLLNVVLIVALLSMLQATLTLPGIAGIVLTVGMAVDANVLIFERIREELANGVSPQMSINSGYDKAFSTIADANITTLIAAIVLFSFGTGPVKGFAVTLSLGIATSMFTAITGTRAVVNLIYGGRRLSKISI
ncbi:MAG: protein translocase subunit SecD [Gammaproteobacteria bacterium]|nr:protein translocase subunit SecD [Gammaproteobacteria bacterium]MCP5199417.1 protein translocase subunit SecD [Gammaproteobacteria bacterium]